MSDPSVLHGTCRSVSRPSRLVGWAPSPCRPTRYRPLLATMKTTVKTTRTLNRMMSKILRKTTKRLRLPRRRPRPAKALGPQAGVSLRPYARQPTSRPPATMRRSTLTRSQTLSQILVVRLCGAKPQRPPSRARPCRQRLVGRRRPRRPRPKYRHKNARRVPWHPDKTWSASRKAHSAPRLPRPRRR